MYVYNEQRELLQEFVQLIESSHDYFNENIEFLRSNNEIADEIGLDKKNTNNKKILNTLFKIDALHNHKIVNILGMGFEGIAFELDNGKVLKLFTSNKRQILKKGEMVAPTYYLKRKLDKKTTGDFSNADLDVDDIGKFHATMEKLIPFNKWRDSLADNDSKMINDAFETLEAAVYTGKRSMLQRAGAELIRDHPSRVEWIKSLYAAFLNDFDIDIKPDNLGVRITNGKPTFVFFDF